MNRNQFTYHSSFDLSFTLVCDLVRGVVWYEILELVSITVVAGATIKFG